MKKPQSAASVGRLEDLPNIGKRIANDLRGIGISDPAALAHRKPLEIYHRLAGQMGERHDPCVLHTLLAVSHFLETAEARPWWEFTAEGRELLRKPPQ